MSADATAGGSAADGSQGSGRLEGLTLLVTGANRGIGLKMTEGALARGAARVIATARAPEQADALNALARLTGKIEVVAADVAAPGGLDALERGLQGRSVDVLIANAGVLNAYGGLSDDAHTLDAWREVLMTNVYGPYATVKAVLPALKRSASPRIAILASIMGSSTFAIEKGNAYPYRTSKAAAVNLARNLAAELKADGIAVGAYHPGWVRTEMGGPNADIDPHTSAEGLLDRFAALTMERTGVFEDYAGAPIPF